MQTDFEKLRSELRGYTDQEASDVEKALVAKIDKTADQLKTETERVSAEFENFRNKEHRDMEARVSALEKKFLRLQDIVSNLGKIPQSTGAGGGGVSQADFDALVQRVDNIEALLANLRDEFSKWIKEFQDNLN